MADQDAEEVERLKAEVERLQEEVDRSRGEERARRTLFSFVASVAAGLVLAVFVGAQVGSVAWADLASGAAFFVGAGCVFYVLTDWLPGREWRKEWEADRPRREAEWARQEHEERVRFLRIFYREFARGKAERAQLVGSRDNMGQRRGWLACFKAWEGALADAGATEPPAPELLDDGPSTEAFLGRVNAALERVESEWLDKVDPLPASDWKQGWEDCYLSLPTVGPDQDSDWAACYTANDEGTAPTL